MFKCLKKLFTSKKPTEKPRKEPKPVPEKRSKLDQLVRTYHSADIEFEKLKGITLAQWLLESGRATSELSTKHNNFGGLKWRGDLGIEGATKVSYKAHDGETDYAKLNNIQTFIAYYWKFIDRPVYDGWRKHSGNPEKFLRFIVDAGYCPDKGYVDKVLSLWDEAEDLLENIEDEISRSDNAPVDTVEEPEPDENQEILLWYPGRVKDSYVSNKRMKTRGRYRKGYPEGAIVHWTSGRSRSQEMGGRRNAKTPKQQGEWAVGAAVDRGSFAYFVIDAEGRIHQNFPLNKWGYHAGSSSWKGLNGTVSDELVGIEVMCAGGLSKVGDGKFKSWFTKPELGDKYFTQDEVRFLPRDNANIKKGYYHKYTPEQEEALIDLLIWLEENGQGIFKFKYTLGHDEVSPGRKTDPGGSLSQTMPEFRKTLSQIKQDKLTLIDEAISAKAEI